MPLFAPDDKDEIQPKEGADVRTTFSPGSNLVLNFRERRVANLTNIHRRIMERQGMVEVNPNLYGPCDCTSGKCRFRYYPGVKLLNGLQMSDAEALLRRVWPEAHVQRFGNAVESLQQENERLRRLGLLRKGNFMFLGRIPGPLVRGVCHDFPEEFSTRAGQTIDIQHKHLEKVFAELFVNRVYSRRPIAEVRA